MFGSHNRIERFARYVARRVPKGPVEIGIGHAICEEDAQKFADHLRDLVPEIAKLVVTGLGTGIGVHGGPHTLLVSLRPFTSAQDIARS
jgi:fatty acid-binding protein DegV